MLTFDCIMLSDECYCSCFWCHISSVPSYCTLLCASKCRVLNEWQPVVRCVGCGGLRQWIITVMCWQSLSTPPEALDNYTQMAQLCHLFKKKKSSEKHSPYQCLFLHVSFVSAAWWWGFPAHWGMQEWTCSSTRCRCQRAFHWRHLSLEKLDELY